MTGYGKVVLELPAKTMRIEIRSLNSKSLDLSMRMPSDYRSKELELRKIIGNRLGRGKVDLCLYVERNKTEAASKINNTVVQNYIQQLKTLTESDSNLELLKMAIKMPDAISTEKEEVGTEEWTEVLNAVTLVLDRIQSERYRRER